MRKSGSLYFIFVLIGSVIFCNLADAKPKKGNLYDEFVGQTINVYIHPLAIQEKNAEVNLKVLRGLLDDSLANRKSLQFNLVDQINKADIEIKVNVVEFLYTDDDPIDTLVSLPMAALDAMKKESYSRLIAEFEVIESGTGKSIWSDRVKGTTTQLAPLKDQGGREELIQMAHEDLVKSFIKKCFAKQRK